MTNKRYSPAALATADELFSFDTPQSARMEDVTRTVRVVFLNAVAQLEAAFSEDHELGGIIGILASALVSHAAEIDDLNSPTGIGNLLRAQVGCHAKRLDVCPASILTAFVRGIPADMERHRRAEHCANSVRVEISYARPPVPHTPKGQPS